MFSLLITILFVTALGIAAVFFMIAEDLDLNNHHIPSRRESFLIINSQTSLVNTKEQLQIELELLNKTLNEKQRALAKSKENISLIIEKLNNMLKRKHEYQKCYSHLKYGIDKAEVECEEIQRKINEYTRWDNKMKSERMQNTEKCQKLLDILEPGPSSAGSVEYCQEKIDSLLKLLDNNADSYEIEL